MDILQYIKYISTYSNKYNITHFKLKFVMLNKSDQIQFL
jgi:hypothetical protein